VTLELAPGDLLVLLSDGFYEQLDASGDEFGEQRVEALVREHHRRRRRSGARGDPRGVDAHAGATPQADDMTAVILRRAAASMTRMFARDFASIERWCPTAPRRSTAWASTARCSRRSTSWWKSCSRTWSNTRRAARATSAWTSSAIGGGVEVTLTDYDVEAFDVTRAPDVDVGAPIEARRPGGLGLHLIRRMVDAIEYRYSDATRESRTTFRKTAATAPPDGAGAATGG
jgi:hypothetical protein